MLQVDQVGRLVAEVVRAEAVEDEADALLHLLNHSAGFCVLNHFTGAVLGGRAQTGAWPWAQQGQGQGLGALLEPGTSPHVSGRGLTSGRHGPRSPASPAPLLGPDRAQAEAARVRLQDPVLLQSVWLRAWHREPSVLAAL